MYTQYKSSMQEQLETQQQKRDSDMWIHKMFVKNIQQGNLTAVKSYLKEIKDNLILDYPISQYENKPPYAWTELSDKRRGVLIEAISMIIMKEGKENSVEILNVMLEHLKQHRYEMSSFLNDCNLSAALVNVFNGQPIDNAALIAIRVLAAAGWDLNEKSINTKLAPWNLQGVELLRFEEKQKASRKRPIDCLLGLKDGPYEDMPAAKMLSKEQESLIVIAEDQKKMKQGKSKPKS